MFKRLRRRFRMYRYEHQYDHPILFSGILLLTELLKILAVAVAAYGLYKVIT